jgi:uncharacterized protein (DUF4415 family)
MSVKKNSERPANEASGSWRKRDERSGKLLEVRSAADEMSPIERARRAAEAISDEEDAAITSAAKADPDAQPVDELFARRGRPRLSNPKKPVLLRLDADVVSRFKAGGEGWQTRMNAALRKAVNLD